MFIQNFLNTTFYQFDYTILNAVHEFALNGGLLFKPIISFFDLFGTKGIGFIIIAIFLFFSKKNKKDSYLIVVSAVLCLVINSLLIKKIVARPRPFMADIEEYKIWWEYVGSIMKDSFSFMSGHTLLSVSCFLSLFFEHKNIKYLILTIVWTIFTILSRLFFVVHYPSDCLFGILFGIIFAYIAYIIVEKMQDKFDLLAKKIFPFAYDK